MNEDKYDIKETVYFHKWLEKQPEQLFSRILTRINRVKKGNWGEYRWIDNKIVELKFDFGKGYRIYFAIKQQEIIILLNGGDKSSQDRDIEKAKKIFEELKNPKKGVIYERK